jgi:hypothetical protein
MCGIASLALYARLFETVPNISDEAAAIKLRHGPNSLNFSMGPVLGRFFPRFVARDGTVEYD